jgi:hypothetical protein
MALSALPYIAFMLLLTVTARSAFVGIVIGLGYTQLIELILASLFIERAGQRGGCPVSPSAPPSS